MCTTNPVFTLYYYSVDSVYDFENETLSHHYLLPFLIARDSNKIFGDVSSDNDNEFHTDLKTIMPGCKVQNSKYDGKEFYRMFGPNPLLYSPSDALTELAEAFTQEDIDFINKDQARESHETIFNRISPTQQVFYKDLLEKSNENNTDEHRTLVNLRAYMLIVLKHSTAKLRRKRYPRMITTAETINISDDELPEYLIKNTKNVDDALATQVFNGQKYYEVWNRYICSCIWSEAKLLYNSPYVDFLFIDWKSLKEIIILAKSIFLLDKNSYTSYLNDAFHKIGQEKGIDLSLRHLELRFHIMLSETVDEKESFIKAGKSLIEKAGLCNNIIIHDNSFFDKKRTENNLKKKGIGRLYET